MKKLLLLSLSLLFLLTPLHAQVSAVGTVGGYTYYKPPAVYLGLDARRTVPHTRVFGLVEGGVRLARKPDTIDLMDYNPTVRGVVAFRVWKDLRVGGGYAWNRQYTSLYTKQAHRPMVYLGTNDFDLFYLLRGSDVRNGTQGVQVRWYAPLNKRVKLVFSGEILRGYATDQPNQPDTIGGVAVGVMVRLK